MINQTIQKRFGTFRSYFLHTLFPIIVYGVAIGILVGAVIWAYSYAVEFVGESSGKIYALVRSHPTFIPLLFIGLAALAMLSYFNVRFTPEVSGSGVPYAEGVMRGLLPLQWIKMLFSMIFGSLISFFAGLPLGSEGPSVLIGGCIGKGVNDVGGKKNKARYGWSRVSVTGGASAGFAVAFNAPLAGIIFALEEGHKRFSPMLLLPASASVIVATVTAKFLTLLTGHGIATGVFVDAFMTLTDPTLSEVGYLILLGLMMGVFSVMFSVALNAVTNGMRRLKVPMWCKFIAAFLFAGGAGLLLSDAIGGGSAIINKVATASIEWKILLALLAVKLATIIFSSASGVTGGLFIPILAVGAMFGGLTARLMMLIGMDKCYYEMVVLISMCAFLGGVMRSPITAIVLVVELTNRLTGSLWAACIVILLSYFIIELFNIEPIYDNALGYLVGKRNAGLRRKLATFEMEVESGSFAIGRSVRDVLWPANTLVIKEKRVDADGNIIYRMDGDGEHKIHEGDKFIIQAETVDVRETYRQLSYLVKRPGFADEVLTEHTDDEEENDPASGKEENDRVDGEGQNDHASGEEQNNPTADEEQNDNASGEE